MDSIANFVFGEIVQKNPFVVRKSDTTLNVPVIKGVTTIDTVSQNAAVFNAFKTFFPQQTNEKMPFSSLVWKLKPRLGEFQTIFNAHLPQDSLYAGGAHYAAMKYLTLQNSNDQKLEINIPVTNKDSLTQLFIFYDDVENIFNHIIRFDLIYDFDRRTYLLNNGKLNRYRGIECIDSNLTEYQDFFGYNIKANRDTILISTVGRDSNFDLNFYVFPYDTISTTNVNELPKPARTREVKAYSNPANDIRNISFSEQFIENISIFNSLGIEICVFKKVLIQRALMLNYLMTKKLFIIFSFQCLR